MRSIIKEPFLELQAAAKKELNINLMPTTAFRDESFQRTLYTNYVNKEGVAKADTYSARPSYSEHQTGLSIDLKILLYQMLDYPMKTMNGYIIMLINMDLL